TDVQAWLDATAPNYGWLLKTNEAAGMTTKRFDTHEVADPNLKPRLTVTFQPPVCPGDADGNHSVGVSDIAVVIQNWFVTGSPGTLGDLDGNGARGVSDIAVIIQNWGQDC
ncbi:MAG TPA: hypothetical protein VG797_01005, partial [Phycisphaerales bacterium]|nr:hypothetical protein [Phycisphaerales bacterium]